VFPRPEIVSNEVEANVEEIFVVVAWVVVAKRANNLSKEDEAFTKIPIVVEGWIARCPTEFADKYVQFEPPDPPPPVASRPQENTPVVSAFTSQLAAFKRETVRFEVEAFWVYIRSQVRRGDVEPIS
jgi:hypothetical protein